MGFHSATETRLVKITMQRPQTREDSSDISVEHGVRQIESNAQDGPGGVIANSGQRANLVEVPGKCPGKAASQFLGGLMEVTGAAVVAKSRP